VQCDIPQIDLIHGPIDDHGLPICPTDNTSVLLLRVDLERLFSIAQEAAKQASNGDLALVGTIVSVKEALDVLERAAVKGRAGEKAGEVVDRAVVGSVGVTSRKAKSKGKAKAETGTVS
jgi:16S rRNA U1498 N3-methylase RsmE